MSAGIGWSSEIEFFLIPAEEVSCVDLVLAVLKLRVHAVGHNDIAECLELLQISDYRVGIKLLVLQGGFVDAQGHTGLFQTLHDTLNGRLTEVVAVGLHGQAIDAHALWLACQDLLGNEVLPGAVGCHNGGNDVIGGVLVVGQQLMGVLGQAVAAVAEGRIVVMGADSGIQAHALDDLACIEAVELGIGVEFVEEGHTQGQIGIGKELDGLSLCGMDNERGHIVFKGAFLEQVGKGFCLFPQPRAAVPGCAHNDARGVQVVVQGPAFTQKLRREEQVGQLRVAGAQAFEIAHGHGGLDDNGGLRVDVCYQVQNGLDRGGIEAVVFRNVVGRRGNDNEICRAVGLGAIQGGSEVEILLGKIGRDFPVHNGGFSVVQQINLGRNDIHGSDGMSLGKKNSKAQAHITSSGNGNMHYSSILENEEMYDEDTTV